MSYVESLLESAQEAGLQARDYLARHERVSDEVVQSIVNAGAKHDRKAFQELCARGVDLRTVDREGNTAMHRFALLALSDPGLALIGMDRLLDRQPKIASFRNHAGDTPLELLLREAHRREKSVSCVIDWLFKPGNSPSPRGELHRFERILKRTEVEIQLGERRLHRTGHQDRRVALCRYCMGMG